MCRNCVKCLACVLHRYWGWWRGTPSTHTCSCCRPLFLITCTLYLWHMLLTRPSFHQNSLRPDIQPFSVYLSGFICFHPPSAHHSSLSWPSLSSLSMPNTSQPQGLWTYCFIRLDRFPSETYTAAFLSFGSLLKHLLIVKPSLNNGRKTAQGSATIPLLPISLILLQFCSLFFLSPPDIFYDFSLSAFALLGVLFCLLVSPATRTMPGIW